MLREIIKPTTENYILHIPKEYINKRIEILVLPIEDEFENNHYQLWSSNELEMIGKIGFSSKSFIEDDEDYITKCVE